MAVVGGSAAGNAYVAGLTFDDAFPATPGAWQTVVQAEQHCAGKLNPQRDGVGNLLGGKSADERARSRWMRAGTYARRDDRISQTFRIRPAGRKAAIS